MKYFSIFFLLLGFSCASKQHPKPENTLAQTINCAAPSTLKMITFCASPQAADQATLNLQIDNKKTFENSFSPLPIQNSPSLGPDDALVTVIMFSDLECPFCKDTHKIMVKMAQEKKIRLVFKHAPMPFHQSAIPASLGAISAAQQEKFWEFASMAFENQADLSGPKLTQFATKMGLDVERWKSDFGNKDAIGNIENDMVLARSVGVNATPTMFVNGVRIVGAFPEAEFKKIIATQNKNAQKLVDAGVKREDVHWRMLSVNYQPAEVIADEAPLEEDIVVKNVPIDGAPTKGAKGDDVLVTVVQFSDFQCPLCQSAHVKTKQIIAENASDTRMVFRHFPLPFHEDADVAAVASMVAQGFGKFWEYNDLLFTNQDALDYEALAGYAKRLGISKRKFKKAFKNKKNTERLAKEVELAQDLAVQGTPTYFINGIMVLGLPSDGSFEALIESQRTLAKKIAKEKGLKGEDLYQALLQFNANNL